MVVFSEYIHNIKKGVARLKIVINREIESVEITIPQYVFGGWIVE